MKIAVSILSNATPASDMAKTLRVTAYLDRQDVSTKLIDYLSPQKVASLSNEELADLHSSLVLVRFTGESRKQFKKFVQTLEYLMMRRVHTFEAVDLAKIISAYGHLIR